MKNEIIMKQATLKDTKVIESILMDAVYWMRSNGLDNMWNETNTSWEYLSKSYQISQFYIAYSDHSPAACMALTDYDSTYWPDLAQGDSLYLHKLATMRQFAGQGISTQCIAYAKSLASTKGCNALRLDCNGDRIKLRQLYEKQGFVCVKEQTTSKGYPIALYCMKIKGEYDD